MTQPEVDVDRAAVAALLNETDSLTVLTGAARDIAEQAKSITRRGSDPRHGHIADQYVTESAKQTAHGGEAVVGNTDPFFHLEEFGSINQAPQRPLYRAITAAGFKPEAIDQ